MATLRASAGQAQSGSEKDDAIIKAQATGREQGILTAEPTPGPDEARNQADEQRRQAISSEGNYPPEQSGAAVDDETTSGTSSSKTSGGNPIPQGRIGKNNTAATARQRELAVIKVLKCNATAYAQILGWQTDSPIIDISNASLKLAALTNPKKNKRKRASEAYKILSMLCVQRVIGFQNEFTQKAHDWLLNAARYHGVDMTEYYGNNDHPPSFSMEEQS